MYVSRGRAGTIDTDRKRTGDVRELASEGDPALRVWCPHRQVAFGPRDRNVEGFERARAAAEDRGFPTRVRSVGGRAVAFAGSTLSVVHARPVESPRGGIDARYEAATDRIRRALAAVGVDARPGEPPDSFCPGSHSLQADGKLAGIAQRVTREVATVSAVIVVTDRQAIASVLSPVYDHLGVAFDPDSVDSVAAAGGPDDPETVGDAVVDAVRAD